MVGGCREKAVVVWGRMHELHVVPRLSYQIGFHTFARAASKIQPASQLPIDVTVRNSFHAGDRLQLRCVALRHPELAQRVLGTPPGAKTDTGGLT